jgi:threonine synthase
LLGAYFGFKALNETGVTDSMPRLVGVQAQACAPVWAAYEGGSALAQEQETLAEGIRILQPLRKDAILRAVDETGGAMVALEEAEIERGLAELALRGFLVEPTSAVIWPALEQLLPDLPEPVVAVLTGSGFKTGLASWPVGMAHNANEQVIN